jgi:iron complex outermembrane recepter protein
MPAGARLAAALAYTLLVILPAAAATDDMPAPPAVSDELEEVVVTGSRIRRPDDERLEPTQVIGGQYLDERSITNVLDALKELPNVGTLGNSLQAGQSAFGAGQSFVNLYTLGSNRTLTLVDGRRFVSGNSASVFGATGSGGEEVDLNVIPTELVDRIEVASVGGTPVYGSDAISGTVNIILKHDYQGFQIDAQSGISGQGDSSQSRLRLLGGRNFDDGRGNIEVSAELANLPGLLGSERRPYSSGNAFLEPTGPSPYQWVMYPNVVLGGISASGVPTVADVYANSKSPFAITSPSGQVLAFNQGHLAPWTFGTPDPDGITNVGGDGHAYWSDVALLSAQQRINTTLLGRFDLNDHARLFGELWFSETHTFVPDGDGDPNTAFINSAGLPGGNLIISAANPFLSAADQATIARNLAAFAAIPGNPTQTDHFYLSRFNDEIESDSMTEDQNTKRAVLGIEGPLPGLSDVHYEVSGNYGRLVNQSATPSVNYQNFFNALDAVRGPNGSIVCAGGYANSPAPTASSTCAPFNPFGFDLASPAAKAYVTSLAQATSVNTQRIFTASLDGTLFPLPTGPLKFAGGYENRRESAEFDPDPFYEQGAGQDPAILPIAGAFHTNEVFGELEVPVLEPDMRIPAAHRLELEGAIRDVDHSIAGKTITWTGGFRFEPVASLMIRGNYTRAIRAPTLTEADTPESRDYDTVTDPCDAHNIGDGPDPAVRAVNCAAAGIRQPFTSNTGFTPTYLVGNASLKNEIANSRTFGFVAKPLDGLSLQVDYIGIDLKQAIQELDSNEVLDACYDARTFPNEYCSRVIRGADGQITQVVAGFFNEAHLTMNGISSGLEYRFDVPFAQTPGGLGVLDWRVDYFFANHNSVTVVDDYYDISSAVANSRHQANTSLRWAKGPVYALWHTLFVSRAVFYNGLPADYADYTGVPSWCVHDLTIGYAPGAHFRIQLLVNNLFDRQPPAPAPIVPPSDYGVGGISRYFSGLMGRYFVLSASYRL